MQKLKEQEQEGMQHNKDEIDLLDVFNHIRRFFLRIGRKINFTIHAIKAHFLIVATIVVIGAGLGYAGYMATKPYYTSTMTLVLAEIRNEFVEGQLSAISEMVEDDNAEMIANTLDINVQTAQQIKSMRFSNLDEERVSQDSILTGSPFQIELSLYDHSLYEIMEPAITNYLENNRYFSKQKRIRQQQVEDLIAKYKEQLSSMDTIKADVISPRGPVNGFVYGEPIDPTNLYRESISLYQQQVELEAELAQIDNIQVVNGFYARRKPTGPDLLKCLSTGAIIALFFAVIVAISMEENKKDKDF